MRSQALQRAVLLILVAFFVVYTTIQYISTRSVLAQCAAITAAERPPSKSDLPGLKITSDLEPTVAHLQVPVRWEDEEEQDRTSAETLHVERSATIGKVTMLYGAWAEIEENKAILQTHRDHAKLHGHSVHVLDRQIMHGLWSKLSYMLMLVLEELVKPEENRMKWLFWFDLDIIVMNANIPLDIYLPPKKEFPHIHLIVTNDHNGLNSGSFFLKVNEWAVKYLVDIIALHGYRPEVKLKYSDQSAQEHITLDKTYVNNTMYVPQRWFNSYLGPRNDRGQLIRGEAVPPNTIKAGDLQLHFAGKKVKHLMPTYLAFAANNTLGWEMPLESTKLKKEIALFWKLEKEKQDWDAPVAPKKKPKDKVSKPAVAEKKEDTGLKSPVKEKVGTLGSVADEVGHEAGLGPGLDTPTIAGNSDLSEPETDNLEEAVDSR